jgi:hypothetical protein
LFVVAEGDEEVSGTVVDAVDDEFGDYDRDLLVPDWCRCGHESIIDH